MLDWNTPSISFYETIGAKVMDDWKICRMSGDALARFASGELLMKIVLVAAIGENDVIGARRSIAVALALRSSAFQAR